MRFMGKRQIGTLQPSELAVTILMSNIASVPIENIDLPLILGIAPIIILLCFEYFFSLIGLKSRRFRRMVCGKPIFIIEDGKILSHIIASQIPLHAKYGGVVPELASRAHIIDIVERHQVSHTKHLIPRSFFGKDFETFVAFFLT